HCGFLWYPMQCQGYGINKMASTWLVTPYSIILPNPSCGYILGCVYTNWWTKNYPPSVQAYDFRAGGTRTFYFYTGYVRVCTVDSCAYGSAAWKQQSPSNPSVGIRDAPALKNIWMIAKYTYINYATGVHHTYSVLMDVDGYLWF